MLLDYNQESCLAFLNFIMSANCKLLVGETIRDGLKLFETNSFFYLYDVLLLITNRLIHKKAVIMCNSYQTKLPVINKLSITCHHYRNIMNVPIMYFHYIHSLLFIIIT